jgi:thymidylate synthase (FAD)
MICDTARVSMAKTADQYTPEQNAKLIRFLAREGHISPFHHPQITLRMQAPVPIRTQCFKSKIGFAENEESRRYISHQPELYVPSEFRSRPEGSIKQGSGATHPESDAYKGAYLDICWEAMELYEAMIEEGICPEQARFVLPQGVEVNWIWTGSLAAYARFYNLRADDHAQAEVNELAEQVGEIIARLFPIAWKELTNG